MISNMKKDLNFCKIVSPEMSRKLQILDFFNTFSFVLNSMSENENITENKGSVKSRITDCQPLNPLKHVNLV